MLYFKGLKTLYSLWGHSKRGLGLPSFLTWHSHLFETWLGKLPFVPILVVCYVSTGDNDKERRSVWFIAFEVLAHDWYSDPLIDSSITPSPPKDLAVLPDLQENSFPHPFKLYLLFFFVIRLTFLFCFYFYIIWVYPQTGIMSIVFTSID